MKKPKGQLSLELLLLAAAFFSFLILLLPAIREVLDTGSGGVDAKAAELFLTRANNAAERLQAFGEGSAEEVGSFALNEWKLSAEDGKIGVEINGNGFVKKIFLETGEGLEFPSTSVRGRFALRLVKADNGVSGSVEVNNQ